MRPLELAVEGFTSFRSAQRIDFSPLDLFAITGPTGAGKSSILDAMTFALYGLTMRTGKQASELVSQGATELKVLLRFTVRGSEYRITRTWRYRPSAPESKVLLERLDGDEWNTLETKGAAAQKVIESTVGMDFDTFTRVILLPQGKFDEFLKGDAPKRRELLRQLAGLEIYERMRKEAAERTKALKLEREAAERQLTLMEVPTPEETFAKREQLAALENGLPALVDRSAAADKALAEEERLFKETARLAELKAGLAALEAKDVAIDVLAERLTRAQKADRLAPEWASLAESRTQEDLAKGAAEAATARAATTRATLAERQAGLDAARAEEAERLPALKAREGDMVAAKAYEEARVRAAEDAAASTKAATDKARAQAAAEAEAKRAAAQAATAKQALDAVERSLSGLRPGGDRLKALEAAAAPLSRWGALAKQAESARRKAAEAAEKHAKATVFLANVAERLKTVERELAEAKSELAAAQAANGEAALHDHARLLRAGLQPGDACLACGGEYHPDHAPALAASTLVELAPLQEKAADRLDRTHKGAIFHTEAQAKLEAAREAEAEALRDLEAAEADLTAARAEVDELLGADWDAEALRSELVALKEADRRHREAADRLKECQAAHREAEQAETFARQAATEALTGVEAARAEAELRARRLAEVESQLHALTGGQPYDVLAAALERDREALKRLVDTATAAFQAAHDAALQAGEAAKQATEAVATATERRGRAEEAWTSALLLAGFTEASFAEAKASADEQAQWQEAVEAHGREKVRLAARVEELAAAIGDRLTDADAVERLRAAAQEAHHTMEEARRALAELNAWLQVAETKQKTAKALLVHAESLAAQEQIFYTLSRDLKADEFQDYLLEFLQADLVARATVILRELTDGRYALRMREGEFWVEDNWNGGDTRRVRTLSGGETFATSLSMALALSEKLAMGSELGSLFLDEGFGTLDAETLESVTMILESLRAQNRMIGVITHVRSLGERLPTQIKVHKAPDGSKVLVEAL
jgi:exonuclease SbcC